MICNYHKFVPLHNQSVCYSDLKDCPDFKVIHNEENLYILFTLNTNGISSGLRCSIDFHQKLDFFFLLKGYIENDHYCWIPHRDIYFIEKAKQECRNFFEMIRMFNIVSPSKLIFHRSGKRISLTSILFKSNMDVDNKDSLNFPMIFGKTSYLLLSKNLTDVNFKF